MPRIDFTVVVFALILPMFIVGFLLEGFEDQLAFNTALVYSVGYAVAFGGLMITKVGGWRSTVMWSKDLNGEDLIWTVAGLAGVLAVVWAFTSSFTASIIEIPRGAQLATLSSEASDVLYNFTLVAPSEELLIVAAAVGLTIQQTFQPLRHPFIALASGRAIWALFHFYVSYGSEALIFPAFISGLIMSAVMLKTQNVLTPIAIHGAYNSIVILSNPSFEETVQLFLSSFIW